MVTPWSAAGRFAPAVRALTVLPAVAVLATSAACGSDDPAARMTADDGAVLVAAPVGERSSFDRSTSELTRAMPAGALQADYTELQSMISEQLVPSEASGCKPDAVRTPALPATELLATRPVSAGRYLPEIASVVGARARSDAEVEEMIAAVRRAAADCASFDVAMKDLGEGSVAPGENGSTSVTDASIGDWSGVRVTTTASVHGATWTQALVRESLVLRKGQVVVHVRAEEGDGPGARGCVDALSGAVIEAVDPDRTSPRPTGKASSGPAVSATTAPSTSPTPSRPTAFKSGVPSAPSAGASASVTDEPTSDPTTATREDGRTTGQATNEEPTTDSDAATPASD